MTRHAARSLERSSRSLGPATHLHPPHLLHRPPDLSEQEEIEQPAEQVALVIPGIIQIAPPGGGRRGEGGPDRWMPKGRVLIMWMECFGWTGIIDSSVQ